MGKVLDTIDDEMAGWLAEQRVFFVATAPLSADGHINCSPKGGDCFRVLGPHSVAYLDYTGSGVETVAHLKENGRIVIMFCAFDGKPQIVRFHGVGTVFTIDEPGFDDLAAHFPTNPGSRAVVKVTVERVSTSCGFSIPMMGFRENRDILDKWAVAKGSDGLDEYRKQKNTHSIDGLPGF